MCYGLCVVVLGLFSVFEWCLLVVIVLVGLCVFGYDVDYCVVE